MDNATKWWGTQTKADPETQGLHDAREQRRQRESTTWLPEYVKLAVWSVVQRYREEIEGWEQARRHMRAAIRFLIAFYVLTLVTIGAFVAKHWGVIKSWF